MIKHHQATRSTTDMCLQIGSTVIIPLICDLSNRHQNRRRYATLDRIKRHLICDLRRLETDSAAFQIEAQSALIVDERRETGVRVRHDRSVHDRQRRRQRLRVRLGRAAVAEPWTSTEGNVDGVDDGLGEVVDVVRHRLRLVAIVDQEMVCQSDVRNRPTEWVPALTERGLRCPVVDPNTSVVSRTANIAYKANMPMHNFVLFNVSFPTDGRFRIVPYAMSEPHGRTRSPICSVLMLLRGMRFLSVTEHLMKSYLTMRSESSVNRTSFSFSWSQ